MKNLIRRLLTVSLFFIAILISYAFLERAHVDLPFQEGYKKVGRTFSKVLLRGRKELKRLISKKEPDHDLGMKAVWVSYLEFEDFFRLSGRSEEEFRDFYQGIVSRSKELGINTLIVQVRPFADALYPSKYYPWSSVISGNQGEDPGYDPLAIMVEESHGAGMKIEAWVNPYRVEEDTEYLAEESIISRWIREESRNVIYYEGGCYLNPAKDEVRKLIADGVREIVAAYDVDGIHMDDYFYPQFDQDTIDTAFDAQEYQEGLEDGTISSDRSIADWRRENVNLLLRLVYKTIKAQDPDLVFGISPNGNPDNLYSDYVYNMDIDLWLSKKGYIDYIMPQIYWGYSHETAPFEEIAEEWNDMASGSHVKLYAGLAAYRLGDGQEGESDREEMDDPGLIVRQIETIDSLPAYQGYSIFSFQYLDPYNEYFFMGENKEESARIRILDQAVRKLEERNAGAGKDSDEE